jgi:hypothetical protein
VNTVPAVPGWSVLDLHDQWLPVLGWAWDESGGLIARTPGDDYDQRFALRGPDGRVFAGGQVFPSLDAAVASGAMGY